MTAPTYDERDIVTITYDSDGAPHVSSDSPTGVVTCTVEALQTLLDDAHRGTRTAARAAAALTQIDAALERHNAMVHYRASGDSLAVEEQTALGKHLLAARDDLLDIPEDER